MVALGGAVLLGSWATLRSLASLHALVQRARPESEVDGIEVRVSDEVAVPFAARLLWRRVIVLDETTAAHETDRAIAIAHERQHHAQQDTTFLYAHALVRIACVLNPFAWLWARNLEELEELACDDAVVRDQGVEAYDYCNCLLRAAEREVFGASPSFAVSLTARGAKSLLQRRIHALTRPRRGTATAAPLALAGLSAMTLAAASADRFLHQDGIAEVGVERLLTRTSDMDVEAPYDELLRASIDEIAGTAAGRRFLQRSLVRAERWHARISEEIAERGLPRELAAIPLVESGYANLEADPDRPDYGAGLWMFVPQTARAYGLAAGDGYDERLDPERQTDAALLLLKDLHDEFGDWGLVLAAYNQGRVAVNAAIEAERTRDPWELIERGALRPYAANVLAAALILEHPETLDAEDPWF
jgi:hypothetical protein